MTSYKIPFKAEAFHRAYVKQRNRELERDLVLAQTKLRYMMEHVASDIVPQPPEASFLSEKDKLEMKEEDQSESKNYNQTLILIHQSTQLCINTYCLSICI